MSPLNITGTEDTPEISYDPDTQVLSIKGSSFPENTYNFYQPIFSWLNEFMEQSDFRQLNVHLDLTYYNSSSSKVFMNLFHLLETHFNSGKSLLINWYYDPDDQDSYEEGEDFGVGLETLPFNLVPKSKES
tara:strand:- start:349 stop:741 length:393 start_codon:yes stop_codon:yes gene_type:complete